MAPRKRGGSGGAGISFIFCCFQSGSDHPEITYQLREDFALQTMEPSLPMPGYDELDGMFSELVVRSDRSFLFGIIVRIVMIYLLNMRMKMSYVASLGLILGVAVHNFPTGGGYTGEFS
jgi:hypothetical protein